MMDYSKILNKTVVDIKPSGIRRFFDISATMDDVISLSIGEPDFQTPWQIRKAGINSLQKGKTKYTSNKGNAELLNEISNYMKRKFQVSYNPQNEILVTVGGSEAIDAAIRALVCYEPMTTWAGGVPVILNTKSENDFKVTPEELKSLITDKTKVLILPYPCNPTGAIMEYEDLVAISKVLENTNIIVISDEIYAELTFNGKPHISPASIDNLRERTITINGFSKAFSMTGWRLGFACGPKEIMEQMIKIHQFAIMCAPTTSQYAAIEALKNCDDDVAYMMNEYNMRRRMMVAGFNEIGLSCREPKGAFYAFPSIKSTGMTSEEFCEKLLYSKKVAVVPGTAFGESGEGFVRASYCYSVEHINEAIERIGEFLKEIK